MKSQALKKRGEFIYDEKGKQTSVILGIRSYTALFEAAEMKQDVEDYRKAVRDTQPDIDSGNFITIGELKRKVLATPDVKDSEA